MTGEDAMYVNLQLGDTAPSYPANVGLSRRRRRNLSASQLVWAKLERTAAQVALVQELSEPRDATALAVLAQCQDRLRLARDQIDRPVRQNWAFWELIHRVDELLLLVTPEEMLAADAPDVLAKFEEKMTDHAVRKAWLGADEKSGPLPRAVERLTSAPPPGAPGARPLFMPRDRHVLRGALNLVNEQGDTNFWRLGSNVSVQSLSALLLLVLFAVALLRPAPSSGLIDLLDLLLPGSRWAARPDALDMVLLGAAGAIISNLLATSSFILSIGATTRYFVHSLLVKPAIGACAAGIVYLLERSGLLFSLSGDSSLVNLNVPASGQGFLRAVIAVAAGFAGEWSLRPMMDKVLRTISARSEKVAPATAPPQRA